MRTPGTRHAATALAGVLCLAAAAGAQAYDPFADGGGGKSSGQIASMQFVDTPITTVFRMVSDLTGWSIVMSPSISEKPPRINLWVKNLAADRVLEQVAELAELIVEREGTTVRVMTLEEYVRINGVEKTVIEVRHVAAAEVVEILKPFVAKEDQTRVLAAEGTNRVVLIAARPLMKSLRDLVEALDVATEQDRIAVVRVKYLDTEELVDRLEGFVKRASTERGRGRGAKAAAEAKASIGEATAAGESYLLTMFAIPELSVVVLRGLAEDVRRVEELIAELDRAPDRVAESFELKYIDGQDAVRALQQLLPEVGGRAGSRGTCRVVAVPDNNLLMAEGAPELVQRCGEIVRALDRPQPPGTGAIRVYRLENTSSREVAGILRELIRTDRASSGTMAPTPLLGEPGAEGIRRVSPGGGTAGATDAAGPAADASSAAGGAAGTPEPSAEVRITEAPEINAVIIRASAAEHEAFATIIAELDTPRDQVLIEVTLVTVQSTDGFRLGLELGGAGTPAGEARAIGFTHFGIGDVNTGTGEIRLPPRAPFGASLAVFNSDDYSLVLNALRTAGDTRISSAPKMLVEDNSEAEIRQVAQEPFEVTDQGQATTTTTFGGFVDAGTVLTVVPHISRRGWLRVEYTVSLSSFGARISSALPPPRSENEITGVVRIPAGHTVVLGGLVRTRRDQVLDKVPWLGDVPWVGQLFRNRSDSGTCDTLYVFIRPVVLRDRDFRDLLLLSRTDVRRAKLRQQDYPCNPMRTFSPADAEPTVTEQ